jgi:hypothetical protein
MTAALSGARLREGLAWPTAVLCYDGGVFVASGTGDPLLQGRRRRWEGRGPEGRVQRFWNA